MLPVEIELLHPKAKPKVGSEQAAGMDLRLCVDTGHLGFTVLNPGQSLKVNTGVKCKIPVGWVGKVYPRSGLGCKFKISLDNTTGIIDSDYRGEILLVIHNGGDKPYMFEDFERIAQMVIVPHYPVYDNLLFVDSISADTGRGESGFGGSGKQ